jgi:hypothetical protein
MDILPVSRGLLSVRLVSLGGSSDIVKGEGTVAWDARAVKRHVRNLDKALDEACRCRVRDLNSRPTVYKTAKGV